MADFKQRIINASDDKAMVCWSYCQLLMFCMLEFLVWEHEEESLAKFLYKLNTFHPTIKFTAEYSKETINTYDVNK